MKEKLQHIPKKYKQSQETTTNIIQLQTGHPRRNNQIPRNIQFSKTKSGRKRKYEQTNYQ